MIAKLAARRERAGTPLQIFTTCRQYRQAAFIAATNLFAETRTKNHETPG
ncbi:hypothetical protein [uncultured Dechloromonas sp.]|nr:hypothetical protein [uncultured Dechloromonas sp.]